MSPDSEDKIELNLGELIRNLVFTSKMDDNAFIAYVQQALQAKLSKENEMSITLDQYNFLENKLEEYVKRGVISERTKDRILTYEKSSKILQNNEFNDIDIHELNIKGRTNL